MFHSKSIILFLFLVTLITGCKCGKNVDKAKPKITTSSFFKQFEKTKLPFRCTDTILRSINIHNPGFQIAEISHIIPESYFHADFANNTKISVQPLAYIVNNDEYYKLLLVRAFATQTSVLYLFAFDNNNQCKALLPLYRAGVEAPSYMNFEINKKFSINLTVNYSNPEKFKLSGKDVYVFNTDSNEFNLVMTDREILGKDAENVNPYETYPQKAKISGDYYATDKNCLLSIRDGKSVEYFNFYLYLKDTIKKTKAEMHGLGLLKSATTGVYVASNDPCKLNFSFNGNEITVTEEGACGVYRGYNQSFNGKFLKSKYKK